ncbi:cation:proton antiporter [Tissierella creatinini]|nr:cation:proton antiporter [Tissierella creatinini]TJX66530.1 cation:proton antiporter [Soehngenia saccharolytica]
MNLGALTETVVSSALVVCFVFAYMAEYTGVSAVIGSYIAGIAISVTNYKHEVFEKVEAISYSIFVPVFFTLIGISAHFAGISKNIGMILIFTIIAILTKFVGASISAKFSGFAWRSSLGIGTAMIARGEVALILAGIGLKNNLLSKDMFAVLVIVVLITTIVTPPMMKVFFKTKALKNTYDIIDIETTKGA